MSSPQPITPAAEWPFTARTAELTVLESTMQPAAPGRPAGAVIVAPAGVGKSRLLREALLGAERNGVPHHRVIATRAARASPYGALSHLAPGAGAHQHDDPASWYRAFAQALATDDGVRPLLTVDDAHLLDDGSAALILHLALSGSATVVAAIRRGEPVPDPLTTLWKEGLVDRIDLQPLSHAEMCHAISAGLGDVVSARTLDQLAQVSNGNLLFARELVHSAIEAGSLEHRGGAWRWDEEIVLAPRLRDTVQHRLGDLSGSERDALGIVALGEPMALDDLAGLTDATTLAVLERGGLIRTDSEGAWRVGHPLYGEVVLAELGKVRTATLSRQLIEVLDGPDLAPAEFVRLASWQLDLGDRPDQEVLAEAAVLANRAFDHRGAERLARAALRQGQHRSAAVALAHACNGQDRYGEAERVLAAAETAILTAADDAVRLRYLDRRHTALYLGLGRRDEAVAMLDRAVASHPRPAGRTDPFLALAHALRAQVALDDGQLSQVVELNEAALAAPEHAGGLGLLIALETTAEAHLYTGRFAAARSLHARMMELAATGEPEVRRGAATAVLQECLCLTLEGRLDQALAVAEQIRQQVVAEPDTRIRSLVALVLGGIQLQRGTAESARRTLFDAVDGFAVADSGGAASWSAAMLAQAEALLGNGAGARAALRRSEELRLARPIARMQVDFVLAEAMIRAVTGDVTGAVRLALAPSVGWDELVIRRVQLLHRSIGMGAQAAAVLDQLPALARQADAPLVASVLDHATALADGDPAGLLDVADWFEATGMLLAAAEATAQASAILRDAGRGSEADRARSRARRLAGDCEGAATPALEQAADLSGPATTLSRREREVADLAAAGLGNAQIADQLVLSVRTVESHLYRAFAKLGVERRDDIAAALSAEQVQ